MYRTIPQVLDGILTYQNEWVGDTLEFSETDLPQEEFEDLVLDFATMITLARVYFENADVREYVDLEVDEEIAALWKREVAIRAGVEDVA